jgi:predicted PurR-regulated permease PerM
MADQNNMRVDVSAASIFRAILIVLLFVFLYLLKDILIILFFAIIIASGISPFANWLEKKNIPRLFGVLLLYLVIFGLLVLVLSLIVPFASEDLAQLTAVFPKIVEKIASSLDSVQQGSPRYFDFVNEVQNLLDNLSAYLQQIAQSAVGLIINIFGGIFSFVAIIVISFYLSVIKRGIENFLSSVIPEKYEEYAIDLWKRAEIKVGRWLQGQLLLGLIVGLLVYIGLSLLNIKFALVFALLAMVLEIVPIAGPILAMIPPLFIAFLQQPSLVLWVLGLYTVIQQLENHILVPLVLGKTTGLNPVVVILALLIGGKLAGIAGAILAVPVATIIVEVIDDLARKKESRRANA